MGVTKCDAGPFCQYGIAGPASHTGRSPKVPGTGGGCREAARRVACGRCGRISASGCRRCAAARSPRRARARQARDPNRPAHPRPCRTRKGLFPEMYGAGISWGWRAKAPYRASVATFAGRFRILRRGEPHTLGRRQKTSQGRTRTRRKRDANSSCCASPAPFRREPRPADFFQRGGLRNTTARRTAEERRALEFLPASTLIRKADLVKRGVRIATELGRVNVEIGSIESKIDE